MKATLSFWIFVQGKDFYVGSHVNSPTRSLCESFCTIFENIIKNFLVLEWLNDCKAVELLPFCLHTYVLTERVSYVCEKIRGFPIFFSRDIMGFHDFQQILWDPLIREKKIKLGNPLFVLSRGLFLTGGTRYTSNLILSLSPRRKYWRI